ncbi:MAG: phage tail tape measure protein [Propionibacteriaceae bacterium]|jgi:TP901 family phage tail tape measure protein|nr:phage tail tape measure protein [Propionibacteriaceae bacterium]
MASGKQYSVVIGLSLDSAKYSAGSKSAQKATEELEKHTGTLSSRLSAMSDTLNSFGWSQTAQMMSSMGVSLLSLSKQAVSLAANFDTAMSETSAAMQGAGLSGEQLNTTMDKLAKLAIEAGGKTKYSAQEAAEAMTELAKANVSAADISGGALYAALNLAASGNLSVADSAELAATSMAQFGLSGADVEQVADAIAAGANKAAGDTGDLGGAIKQAGAAASIAGAGFQETVGVLSAMASVGMIGSQAGTSLRSMLMSLMNPTKESAALMKELGITLRDSNGEFVGMSGLADQLQTGLGGLSATERDVALSTIFGSYALSAANTLYEQGAAGIDGWTAAVSESGYAAELAAEKQNNLQGDLEKLGGAWDTLLTEVGGGAQEPIRAMVRLLTDLVDAIPPEFATTVVVAGGVLGGLLITVGGFMKASSMVNNFNLALKGLSDAGGLVGKLAGGLVGNLGKIVGGFTALTVAVGVVTSIFGAYKRAQEEATKQAEQHKETVDRYIATLDAETQALTRNTAEQAYNNLAAQGAIDAAKTMGITAADMVSYLMGDADAIKRVTGALEEQIVVEDIIETFWDAEGNRSEVVVGQTQQRTEASEKVTEALGLEADAIAKAQLADKERRDAVNAATEATENNTDATETNTDAIQENNNLIEEATSLRLGEIGSLINLEASYDKATEAAQKNGKTLDINTAAGRDNMGALTNIAEAALKTAAAMRENGSSVEEVDAQMQRAREAFLAAALAMGVSEEQADALAATMNLIPKNTTLSVTTDFSNAETKIQQINRDLDEATRSRTVNIKVTQSGSTYAVANGGVFDGNIQTFAHGGLHESHLAQIAPAGAWRVWAEPETGGEAYIPLALSKRARSEAILEQVAHRFGLGVIRAADGYMATPVSASSVGASVSLARVESLLSEIASRDTSIYVDGQRFGAITDRTSGQRASLISLGGTPVD